VSEAGREDQDQTPKEQSYPLRKAIELTSSMRQVLKGELR